MKGNNDALYGKFTSKTALNLNKRFDIWKTKPTL